MPKAKVPTGVIVFDDSDPDSWNGTGSKNPRQPWKVRITFDPHGYGIHQTSHRSYARAAMELARELAWRDPEVVRLTRKAESIKQQAYRAHLDRLTDERPDPIPSAEQDPNYGRYAPDYYSEEHWLCSLCHSENDHESLELAHYHGCSR